MTRTPERIQILHDPRDTDQAGSEREDGYLYRHAGLREHHGSIPLWLKSVILALLIWSVYYTVRFWTAP